MFRVLNIKNTLPSIHFSGPPWKCSIFPLFRSIKNCRRNAILPRPLESAEVGLCNKNEIEMNLFY